MSRRLEGRVAIVTGAGKGIGRSTALLFAAEGARLVVATRSEDSGHAVVDEIRAAGGEAMLVAGAIGSRQHCEDIVARAVAEFGGLDILLHNAATFNRAAIVDLDDHALDDVLNVNLKAAFWFAAAAIPHLRASSCARLLFTSSITGSQQSHPEMSAYGASKAGLNGFIRQAAYELAANGITVNGVAPGLTLTDAAQKSLDAATLKAFASIIPRGRPGLAEEMAHVLLMLAEPGGGHLTGQIIAVDGGQSLGTSFPR